MGNTVLVVEDNTEQRTVMRLILERAGYTVAEAVNGAEALQYLMSYTPDVLVLDILMPMLGGGVVLERIQQMPALRDMRVVVVTAYPRFRAEAERLGVDAFLIKPVTPAELLQAIEAALQGA